MKCKMSREERLGRALLKIYGLKWYIRTNTKHHDYAIIVDLPEMKLSYSADSWRRLLIDPPRANKIPEHDRNTLSPWTSLTSTLKILKLVDHVIEYSSLDDLEIQLTLMGLHDIVSSK